MSTHLPGFQSSFSVLHHFVFAKLLTSSLRVKVLPDYYVPSAHALLWCSGRGSEQSGMSTLLIAPSAGHVFAGEY